MSNAALNSFLQHVVNGVSLGAIYALIALGYTMVFGILQLINFAHSDVFMIGAYLGYFSAAWVVGRTLPLGVLIWFGLPLVLFLGVINHQAISRKLGRPAVRLPERSLLLTAVLAGAMGAALAACWYWPSKLTVITEGVAAEVPSIGLWTARIVVVIVLATLAYRRLLIPMLTALLVGAVGLAVLAGLFPVASRLAQSIQVGAITANAPGKIEKIESVTQVSYLVRIGDQAVVVPDGDEPTVKEKAEVKAGDKISQKGMQSPVAGVVGRVDRTRASLKRVHVATASGVEKYDVPSTHTVAVRIARTDADNLTSNREVNPFRAEPAPLPDTVAKGDKISSGIVIGTPLFVMLLSMLGCATLGFLIERTAYRPLRRAPRINSLITAIGMSLLLENSAQLMFGADPKAFPDIVPSLPPLQFGGVIIDIKQLTVLIVSVALMIVLQYIVYYTKLGLGMRAVSYNHEWAGLMGIPVDTVVSATFIIGSSLAAAAGILVGVTYHKIDPLMGMLLGLKAFVAAVLGGIGNIPGALIGGILMGLSEEMVAGYWSSNFRDAIAFAILVMILLVRPAGILGKPYVEKV